MGQVAGMDKKTILGAVAAALCMMLAGSVGWVASTTIAHGQQLADTNARISSVESSNEQIRGDLRYVRDRVDEIVKHLLGSL